jgi:hypothetical protein
MKRQIKDATKRWFFYLSKLISRCGVHAVPVHYYSPLPNIPELEKTLSIWATQSELPGLSFDVDVQSDNLRGVCLPYQGEFAGNRAYKEAVSENYGPGYGYIEAQALHAVIRHFKPARCIEVGSGVSTFCIKSALGENATLDCRRCSMTCVEPYPSSKLKHLEDVSLIQKPVQEVPASTFEQLEAGDFLFIDSSHVVKPGSDVNYLILEILPRLKPGVIVHFHDIYFPYDYPRDLLQNFFSGAESSLLQAFLVFNDHVEILFSLSYLHYLAPSILKEVFPEYTPQPHDRGLTYKHRRPFQTLHSHFPSSIYFRMR